MARSILDERFEAKVDRSGEHHLWLGSKKVEGSGKLKVDGVTLTAARVPWELANGPLKHGTIGRGCPAEPGCVRIDHLSVVATSRAGSPGRAVRAPRGSGSKREIRPGVWKLTISTGHFDDGSPRREHRTVEVRGPAASARALAQFRVEVEAKRQPNSRTAKTTGT